MAQIYKEAILLASSLTQKDRYTKMFGPVEVEKAEGCNKLYGKQLSALYSSSNMSGVIKSMKMRWTGYCTHEKEKT